MNIELTRIDRAIRFFVSFVNWLMLVFGRTQWKEPKVYISYHNLNVNEELSLRGWPRMGRFFVYLHKYGRAQLSWTFFKRYCHTALCFDPSNAEIYATIAIPFLASFSVTLHDVYWMFNKKPEYWFAPLAWMHRRYDLESRQLRVAIHDSAIWVNIWTCQWGWDSKTPRWRNWSFNPIEFALGDRTGVILEVLEDRDIVIPMPEGPYKGKAKLELVEFRFARTRLFSRRFRRVHINNEIGIPGGRKGSVYGMSMSANTIAEGIGHYVGDILKESGISQRLGWQPPSESTFGQLLARLQQHVGKTGLSESAVETLDRLLQERERYKFTSEQLFGLLDHIDSVSDLVKSDNAEYRRQSQRLASVRWRFMKMVGDSELVPQKDATALSVAEYLRREDAPEVVAGGKPS